MYKKWIVILMCIVTLLPISVHAGISPNSINELEESETRELVEIIDIELINEPEQANIKILNFDIDSKGNFAVMYNSLGFGSEDIVCVYNHNWEFLYGFSFYDPGIAYAVFIDDEVGFASVRSEIIVMVNQEGCITNIYNYNNDVISYIASQAKNYDGAIYRGETDAVHGDGFTRIVMECDESKTVVKQLDNTAIIANKASSIGLIVLMLFSILIFPAFIPLSLVFKVKRRKEKLNKDAKRNVD